jgi:hypothetical protein
VEPLPLLVDPQEGHGHAYVVDDEWDVVLTAIFIPATTVLGATLFP